MNLVEYHVLIPIFADPRTAFEGKHPEVQERLRAALRCHLLEAALVRAEARLLSTHVQNGSLAGEVADQSARPLSPDQELETFLGPTIAAWCSDELRWRILDEALQLRIEGQGDRAIELPSDCFGPGGVDEQVICALAHYGLLVDYTGPSHSGCAFPRALAAIASAGYTPPLTTETDPFQDTIAVKCDTATGNLGSIKLHRLALLTHRHVWSRLEQRRKEFAIAQCFLSTSPVDGCYFRKAEGGQGTWDLLLGFVLYVGDDWQDAFDRYLAKDAQYDLVQDAVYYHKNGLPFMPQLGS